MSTALAEKPPAVPALAYQPTAPLEIDRDDIALPRVKVGQFSTPQVQEELVKPGQVFVTTGEDAEIVYDPAKRNDKGLLVQVLSMFKRKSLSTDGELSTWAFNDPDAPAEAWTTYNYVVCLPEVDDQVPHKWLLTRSGAPAAKQMNTVLAKNASRGPAYDRAFRVTTIKKENDKGKWFVPRVTEVEPTLAQKEAAGVLAEMIAGSTQIDPPTNAGDEPAI